MTARRTDEPLDGAVYGYKVRQRLKNFLELRIPSNLIRPGLQPQTACPFTDRADETANIENYQGAPTQFTGTQLGNALPLGA